MRYAQILNGIAHWVFESETVPEFAPDIVIVDITEIPEVMEGWDYDGVVFTPFKIEEPVAPPPDNNRIAQMISDLQIELMIAGVI